MRDGRIISSHDGPGCLRFLDASKHLGFRAKKEEGYISIYRENWRENTEAYREKREEEEKGGRKEKTKKRRKGREMGNLQNFRFNIVPVTVVISLYIYVTAIR